MVRSLTVPYAASNEWYGRWLLHFAEEGNDMQAILKANAGEESARGFARTLIRGADGRETVLSIPVAGGARALRDSRKIDEILLSDHGDWRRVHLGAIEAAYGRTPFFNHIFPDLKEVYAAPFFTLREFNLAIHKIISSFILRNITAEDVRALKFTASQGCRISSQNPVTSKSLESCGNGGSQKTAVTFLKRIEEVGALIVPSLSSIDSLMRLGPETLLGLAAGPDDSLMQHN